MSWGYIAGFFDGEGNIRLTMGSNTANVQLSLHQAGARGFRVLSEIEKFMAGYGVRSKIAKRKELTGAGKPMYRLYSYDWNSIRIFAKHTMRYLRVKKSEVQDLIRYAMLFPPSPGKRAFRNKSLRAHCRRGHPRIADNLYGNGTCKECAKQRAAARYYRMR